MATEYVDYLILGDEHHGEIHRDIKSHSLRVRSKYAAGSGRGTLLLRSRKWRTTKYMNIRRRMDDFIWWRPTIRWPILTLRKR